MQANRYAAVEGLMVVIHPGCGVWADLKALLQSSDVFFVVVVVLFCFSCFSVFNASVESKSLFKITHICIQQNSA